MVAFPNGDLRSTGFPFAFGVFQEYYSTHEPFSRDVSGIAAVGTTSSVSICGLMLFASYILTYSHKGIMYFAAPVVYFLLRKFPQHRKTCSIVGFVIELSGLIGASFATTVPQLLGTQGILYAIGGSLHYFPAFLYLDEWFVQRKGIAYGVVWAGTGVGGVAIPLTMQWVLSTWGFRTALRTWAVICVILTTPALMLMKGRLPYQHADMGPQKVELRFLKSPAFWMLQLGNVIQGLGHFLPSLYMPCKPRWISFRHFIQNGGIELMILTCSVRHSSRLVENIRHNRSVPSERGECDRSYVHRLDDRSIPRNDCD